MKSTSVGTAALIIVISAALGAQGQQKPATGKPAMNAQAKIRQAMSAAPPDVSRNATIMDWPDKPGGAMKQLRAGTNGWTCMPSTPQEFGAASLQDPMCLDKVWMQWADAWMNKKDPPAKISGIAYMLRGDRGVSNTDPFATGPTSTNDWIVSPPHTMVLFPDPSALNAFPTDPHNGGPWVMWKGTKYAHLMVPVAAMPKVGAGATAKK